MLERRWIPWLGATFLAAFLLVAATAGCSSQANYPTKAIEVTVTMAAGGGVDTWFRTMNKHLSKVLGVPMNIVNKPGGNQIPAVMGVLGSSPDGYTLLAEHPSGSSLHALIKDLPYKMEDRSWGPIFANARAGIFVNGKSPWKTLKDAMDAAKKDPGSFTWVRLGGLSQTDFTTLALLMSAGIDIEKTKPVAFTGSGPGNTAIAGGHVLFGFGGLAAALPLAQSGDIKIIAVNGDKRTPLLPDVPTIKEQGYDAGTMSFLGYSGPKGLPANVMETIDKAGRKLLTDPEFQKDMGAAGLELDYLGPDDARKRILGEVDYYRGLSTKFPASFLNFQ